MAGIFDFMNSGIEDEKLKSLEAMMSGKMGMPNGGVDNTTAAMAGMPMPNNMSGMQANNQMNNAPQAMRGVANGPIPNSIIQATQAPSPPPEQPGFFARMGQGFKDYTSDPEKMARAAAAFNTMRLNPDPNVSKMAQDQIARSQGNKSANQTVALLRKSGYSDLADMVEANPAMAKEALAALTKSKMGTDYSSKNIGSIQTAEDDILENGVVVVPKGGQYTYSLDPNAPTGSQYKIVPLSGAGLTSADKNKMDIEKQKAEWDMTQGLKKGEEVFSQFQLIDDQIQSFARAEVLVGEGAKSGFLKKFLPSTDAATTELRMIANKMGIDIINSATFGALSATELRLALETGFDQNLSGDQLIEYIQNKIAAQTKLRNALMPEVQMLLGGSGLKAYADYKIENRKRHDAAQNAFSQIQKSNPSLTVIEWEDYNLEEREGVMRDGGLL